MAGVLPDTLVLIVATLSAYAVLVWLGNEYSRRTNWQPPGDNQNTNWTLRRNLGIGLGGLAVVVCAIGSAWFPQASWLARLLTLAQAALMAAAGASDLRRFHLPLPLTLAGLTLAIVTLASTPNALLVTLIGGAWAFGVILLHALISKGSMALGDHIATLWIALASPFNGLLAIATGDFANVAQARIQGLRGKKVAAAGAWLVISAALIGLPPYFAWFTQVRQGTGAIVPTIPASLPNHVWAEAGDDIDTNTTETADKAVALRTTQPQTLTVTALITLAEWAGDHTASVALESNRNARVAAAASVAPKVARLAAVAEQIAPGADVTEALHQLAEALKTYDVAEVRRAGLALIESQRALADQTPSTQPIDTTEP
jgi:hypothetical protein